jgi:hypothetical protein
MIRRSKASNARFYALLIACLTASLSACGTSAKSPADVDERRRPDGVAIDPTSGPPPAADHGDSADRVVVLRSPLGVERALATLDELFHKITLEDEEGVTSLLTRDAMSIGSQQQNPMIGAPTLANFWRARMRKLDYTKLAGETVYQESDVEIYRPEDEVSAATNPIIQLDALSPGDLVLRVPLLSPRIGTDRLFGDELVVWMRREGDRYRIYRIWEEFQLS